MFSHLNTLSQVETMVPCYNSGRWCLKAPVTGLLPPGVYPSILPITCCLLVHCNMSYPAPRSPPYPSELDPSEIMAQNKYCLSALLVFFFCFCFLFVLFICFPGTEVKVIRKLTCFTKSLKRRLWRASGLVNTEELEE